MNHTRRPLVSGLGLLLSLLVCSFGCERNRPATEAVGVERPPVAQPALEPAGAEQPSKAEEPSKSCTQDAQCSGYLRCIQGSCTVPPAVSGEHDAQSTPVVLFRAARAPDSKQITRFYAEMAISAQEQQRGLMFRRSMQPDWGMLFVYPSDDHLTFWMKNTLISLDMVFIHSSGEVIGVVEAAEPLTLDRREVDGESRFVFELNAGTAAREGIVKGVWMSIKNVDPAHAPPPVEAP
ncbi:MAG: DUF192 domain-containing protein [Bradymonadaceae bacterium]|nr:DUF192 domain-containing protein [Lujinxingiaceae bacterium]